METTNIHFDQRAIHLDQHPHPSVEAAVRETAQEIEEHTLAYQGFIDNKPNLNEKHEEELRYVRETFSELGIEVAPIYVLDSESFQEAIRQATKLRGETSPNDESSHGFFAYGRIVVQEYDDPDIQSAFGDKLVVGTALHEAAHSGITRSNEAIVTQAVIEQDLATGGLKKFYELKPQGGISGFRKLSARRGEKVRLEGDFIEEGFADSFRVRKMADRDQETYIGDRKIIIDDIRYVGEYAELTDAEKEDGFLNVPAKYGEIKITDPWTDAALIMDNDAGLAAYGIDMLDSHMPGLFDKMIESRRNPALQAEVIAMINDIQPGLYTKLRKLAYTPEDFQEGVRIIQGAIARKESSQLLHTEMVLDTVDNVTDHDL